MKDYRGELETAKKMALGSGEIIRASYGLLGESDVSEKRKNDMVTVVDVRSQDHAVSILREAFPDDFIVAEESLKPEVNEGREGASRRWYIDPLDGTTNYIHAYPMFASSVAFEDDGEIVVGVTYDPMRDELFAATRGHGAFLNDKPFTVSGITDRERIFLATGFPFRARHFLDDYLKLFRFFFNNARGIRRGGSATLDLAYVATGRVDAFWELTLSPWDMAAGILLVREAGGTVSDFWGGSSSLESGHIIASNGPLHDWMVEAIGDVFPPGTDLSI